MQRLFFVLALASAPLAWPQSAAAPGAHSEHDLSAPNQHAHHKQSVCEQMMAGHASEMTTISQTLNSNLAQMKSTLPLINDMNERSRWQSNIAMWQALADHFNQRAKHAEDVQSMGMACGTNGEGEHSEHDHVHSSTPAKAQ